MTSMYASRLEIARYGGDLSRPLTVHWKTADGTAKASLDYIAAEVRTCIKRDSMLSIAYHWRTPG